MLESIWYKRSILTWILWPLSCLFAFVVKQRRKRYMLQPQQSYRSPVAVIIVGNISVGGNGKTPVVLALCEFLKANGYNPGIVSRGYGGNAKGPLEVTPQTPASLSGDEPLLLRLRSEVPVIVCADRSKAARFLIEQHPQSDVIIADDGMQHYPLARDIEICVVDAKRQFGNGFCLPAGPLREPLSRLDSVTRIVTNGGTIENYPSDVMTLIPTQWHRVLDGKAIEESSAPRNGIAVAGIGHPERFYHTLQNQGISLNECIDVGDHGQLSHAQIKQYQNQQVLMTEKDALKYRNKAGEHWYYLCVSAQLPDDFYQFILQRLESFYATRK
ncbi:tetraacyldisaccharide 4'-kinase [Celerinatantimonas diazotrophica]|uniref:Tetraacyldisaccharide 4'-kinase n=1 Tax=Celerinatantimonas diazotrophica TaxID=412034 RepID=A0A4V2PND7_9GAMM|nr:tetraacyldisaccharide 4'-kinase [Celerinatantimonas diazotrophica]TCK46577.1 lipid-A-disaccharide kinase [Celerinatantimonas diazotrophica]